MAESTTDQFLCIAHKQSCILYCKDCCRPVCTLCFSSSSHRHHSFSSFQDAAEILKAKSQSLFEKINVQIKAWNEFTGAIVQIKDQTDQHVSDVLTNLHSYIENIKCLLDRLYLQIITDVLQFLDHRPKLIAYCEVPQMGVNIKQEGGRILKQLDQLAKSSSTNGMVQRSLN